MTKCFVKFAAKEEESFLRFCDTNTATPIPVHPCGWEATNTDPTLMLTYSVNISPECITALKLTVNAAIVTI